MAAMTFTMGLQASIKPPQRATFGCSVKGLRPVHVAPRAATRQVTRASGAFAGAEVPDMEKRTTMNLLLVGALGLPITALAGPFLYFFFPKSAGSGAGGLTAKDALGNDVRASKWLETHKKGDRSLTQGLKADATYLIINDQNEIEKYGLNAVCTHLGCVVPWNSSENKFMCPCHGSQYNFQGKVVRGPAPLSLALAHCDINDDMVVFTPWTEKDFRTGLDPWWA